MVFKPKGGHVFKLRVSDSAGHSAILSTGTTDEDIAEDVERMVKGFKAQRKGAYLTLLATKRVKLAAAYDAFVSGTLDAFMAAAIAESSDVDLAPLVAEWTRRANPKYVAQVRLFIPLGKRFARSHFTRGRISAFLAGLDVSDPTRNRYRAALSTFAKWLVEREVLEANPVRDVAMYAEHDPRDRWLSWADMQRVARKAPEPYRTLLVLLAGTGMEISAALRLTVYDVDAKAGTIHAKGSKTRWRNRIVRAEPFVWDALKAHGLRGLNGELFPGLTESLALDTWRRAQGVQPQSRKVGTRQHVAETHTLHDLRHTYAVNALKAGLRPEVVAHQLGHKDASLVHKTYGRYVPNAEDYATATATAPRKRMKR